MPVTTVNILDGPNIQVGGQYRGVLEFVFHTGETAERFVMAQNQAEWDAKPALMTPEVEAWMTNQEIDAHASSLDNNLDPYFDDMGGWFDKKIDFQHTTWDDSFAKNIKYYLSLYPRTEILHIEETIARISSTDLKNALGITQTQATKISADIQIEVNARESEDTYVAMFDSDGGLI